MLRSVLSAPETIRLLAKFGSTTVFPPAEASTTSARRHFTIDLSVPPPPRLTMR